ncbi:MAG: hypothetical protein K2L72_06030, partial [Clostridia bacterium]|nr:hypothetical protein [Clostridia bacterium]
TREGLEKFAGDKTSVVCGEFDPCAVGVSLLPDKDGLVKQILKGTDHVFSGKISEFVALPEKMLFK